MQIQVKLAGLPARQWQSSEDERFETNQSVMVDVPERATVGDVADRLGITQDQVEQVLVNGEQHGWSRSLQPGDAVALTGGYRGM